MPNTQINKNWDEKKVILLLEGDKPFEIMNENYLFEGMGLSRFDAFDIDQFIGQAPCLNQKDYKKLCHDIKTFLDENQIN